jgi:uncharacterized OB-fold protein
MNCGRLFNYISGRPICPNCKRDLEQDFMKVRTYIRDNSKATIVEISEACNVDVKEIRLWIRQERLSFSKDSAVGIECEKCGRSIRTGRFCEQCKKDVINGFNSTLEQEETMKENPFAKENSSNKMRYFNKRK